MRSNCGDIESRQFAGNEQQTKKKNGRKLVRADRRHQQQQNGPAFSFFKFLLYLRARKATGTFGGADPRFLKTI